MICNAPYQMSRVLATAGGGHNAFRIGDDVPLSSVLTWVSALIFLLMLMEYGLHVMEVHAEKKRKHKEMLAKIYRELMILGMISFFSVVCTEAGILSHSSSHFLAFESAHLLLFFTTISLIFQAITIYYTLNWVNSTLDWLETMDTKHFARYIKTQEARIVHNCGPVRWVRSLFHQRYKLVKILRSYFIKAHRLPKRFDFSKYLHAAEDKQISFLIEGEPQVWIVFVVFWWILCVLERMIARVFQMEDDKLYTLLFFLGGAVALAAAHIALVYYLHNRTAQLLSLTGCKSTQEYTATLDRLWRREASLQIDDAVELDEFKLQKARLDRSRKSIVAIANHQMRPRLLDKKTSFHTRVMTTFHYDTLLIERILKLLLLFNACFLAMYFVGLLNLMLQNLNSTLGILAGILFPLPLFVNAACFQPYIIQQILMIVSIWKCDFELMAEVLDQTLDGMLMKEEVGRRLAASLALQQISEDELMQTLVKFDKNQDGVMDESELTNILDELGLHLSRSRFKTLLKCLTNGTGSMKYEDLHAMVINSGSFPHKPDDAASVAIEIQHTE